MGQWGLRPFTVNQGRLGRATQTAKHAGRLDPLHPFGQNSAFRQCLKHKQFFCFFICKQKSTKEPKETNWFLFFSLKRPWTFIGMFMLKPETVVFSQNPATAPPLSAIRHRCPVILKPRKSPTSPDLKPFPPSIRIWGLFISNPKNEA